MSDTNPSSKKRVVITGITGTLGSALGRACLQRGDEVIGISRRDGDPEEVASQIVASPQVSIEDAAQLATLDADVILLNAGAIETKIGEGGMPLSETTENLYQVNAVFPSLVAIEATKIERDRPLEIVLIGSIADGAPSAFGPVYHASKIAAHYFVAGVGPIAETANPRVRLRLYRPGAIHGPMSWAPVLRLNERGYKMRAKRCEKAPTADRVAARHPEVRRLTPLDRDLGRASLVPVPSTRVRPRAEPLLPNAATRLAEGEPLHLGRSGSRSRVRGARRRPEAREVLIETCRSALRGDLRIPEHTTHVSLLLRLTGALALRSRRIPASSCESSPGSVLSIERRPGR